MQYALAMQNDPRYKNKSLTEIAETCGFNSVSTFRRAYKRATQQDNSFEIPVHGGTKKRWFSNELIRPQKPTLLGANILYFIVILTSNL